MPQTTPIVSIENVVASATIDQKLDLDEIQKKFPDVEYNSEQFPSAVFRLKSPKTATLLVRSSKMECTGSKSSDMAKKAVDSVVLSKIISLVFIFYQEKRKILFRVLA